MRTSLYIPDAMAEQIKAYGISISEGAQAAFQVAIERAQLREKVMGTSARSPRSCNPGSRPGIKWARKTASIEDLRTISGETKEPVSRSELVDDISIPFFDNLTTMYGTTADAEEPDALRDAYEQGFEKGTRAVKPLDVLVISAPVAITDP